MSINGITADTPKKLLLDAGAFYKNYDVTKPFKGNPGALLGATQGGGSFAAVPTVRKHEIDGAKTNTKGLQTIDDWVITMVANVKEVTVDNIKLALGAATTAVSTTPTGYTKITAKNDFEDVDYCESIAWVGTLKGSSNPVIIVLKNALSVNGLNLTVSDNNEAVIPITLTGNYDPTKLDEVPFEIYYPTVA